MCRATDITKPRDSNKIIDSSTLLDHQTTHDEQQSKQQIQQVIVPVRRGKTLPKIVSVLKLKTEESGATSRSSSCEIVKDRPSGDKETNNSKTVRFEPTGVDRDAAFSTCAGTDDIDMEYPYANPGTYLQCIPSPDEIMALPRPQSDTNIPAVVSTSTLSVALPATVRRRGEKGAKRSKMRKVFQINRKREHHQKHTSKQLQVDHTYHDHINDEPPDHIAKYISRGGVKQPFPVKLHEVLDEVALNGKSDVISWKRHGRCFQVRDSKRFAKDMMPEYFDQHKFASFQRQLNLYGFKRLTSGRDRGSYYHELFIRGKPFLAFQIKRQRIKGTGVRMAASPETEPNFYLMKPCVGRSKLNWAHKDSDKDGSNPGENTRKLEGDKTKGAKDKTQTKKQKASQENLPRTASKKGNIPAVVEKSDSNNVSRSSSPQSSNTRCVNVALPAAIAVATSVNRPSRRNMPIKKRILRGRSSSPTKKKTKTDTTGSKKNVCINPVTMKKVGSTSPRLQRDIITSTPHSKNDRDSEGAREFDTSTLEDDDEVQFCGCRFHYLHHLDRIELNEIEAVGTPPNFEQCAPSKQWPNVPENYAAQAPYSVPAPVLCGFCQVQPQHRPPIPEVVISVPVPAAMDLVPPGPFPNFPRIQTPVLSRASSAIVSDDESHSHDDGDQNGKDAYKEPSRSEREVMRHFFETLNLPFDDIEDVEEHEFLDSDAALGSALERMIED